MNRPILLLLLGLAAGVGAHLGYLNWRSENVLPPVGEELEWMRAELKLTDSQYARIASLHDMDRPRVRSLAGRIAAMQKQMDAFESERRTEGQVDFVAFAQFVENFRQVGLECERSTRQLVHDTASVLDPRQREMYLELVEPLVARAPRKPDALP